MLSGLAEDEGVEESVAWFVRGFGDGAVGGGEGGFGVALVEPDAGAQGEGGDVAGVGVQHGVDRFGRAFEVTDEVVALGDAVVEFDASGLVRGRECSGDRDHGREDESEDTDKRKGRHGADVGVRRGEVRALGR